MGNPVKTRIRSKETQREPQQIASPAPGMPTMPKVILAGRGKPGMPP